MEEREGGGGSGTQKCGYEKRPDQIFPTVNFVFFARWSLWSGGGFQGGGGGRDVLERGEGGGGGGTGAPLLLGSPYGPRRRRAENFYASILLAPKAQKQNFGCQPQTLEGGEGGYPPSSSSAVYGRSNIGGRGGNFARGEFRGENFAVKEGGEIFPWRNFGVTVPSFTTAAGIVFPEQGQVRLRTRLCLLMP